MIKINLIPTKRKPPKKVTELQQQMVLGVLILILVGIGMGYHWVTLTKRINTLKEDKAAKEARKKEQEKQLEEVKNVETERKLVTDKIATIEQLKKNQTGPVRMLDELSKMLPAGVNLTSLTEKSGQVDIEGEAFTNNDLVRFVDNLKANEFFTDVFLLESVQSQKEGTDIYKYKMQFKFKGV